MNIDLKDLFKDKQMVRVVLAGFFVLAFLAGVVFGVLKLQEAFAEYENQQSQQDQLLSRLKYLSQLAADDQQTRDTVTAYQEQLPATIRQDTFLARLNEVAAQYHVTITEARFTDPQARGTAQYLPVAVQASGVYANVMEMFDVICYDNQRIITLDTIEVTGTRGEVKVTANLSVFFQASAAPPAAAPAEGAAAEGAATT